MVLYEDVASRNKSCGASFFLECLLLPLAGFCTAESICISQPLNIEKREAGCFTELKGQNVRIIECGDNSVTKL